MKIQSTYKDFYDGVQALGHDDYPYYHRIPQTFSLAQKGGDEEKKALYSQAKTKMPECSGVYDGKVTLERVIVGICGKLYLGLRHRIPSSYETNWKVTFKYYYDTQSLVKAFPELQGKSGGYSHFFRKYVTATPTLGLFDDNCDDIFIALGAPVFVFDAVGGEGLDEWGRNVKASTLVVNPSLKGLEMYRILTDFQVYQELEMYLSNVLVGPREADAPVSDKVKIASHGFDPEYGFRKRKKE